MAENLMVPPYLLIGGLCVVSLVLVLVVLHLRSQNSALFAKVEGIQGNLQSIANVQIATGERLKTITESHASGQLSLANTLEQRLEQVSLRMNTSLSENASKTAESLGKINTRLTVIDSAQKNITDLSGQVLTLQDVLANKQARGAFGEIQLNDIVKSALPPSAYEFQVTLSNGKRADCLLRLEDPPGPMVIDAKFPLEGFATYRDAKTDADKSVARRDFANAVAKHIKDISTKYIVPGETADSALMFLPSEAVYAELHASFVDVVKKSYAARVWIVSPTTMMATLNTIRAVLKDVKMREQAGVIQVEVGRMMEDVRRLQKRVANLQTHYSLVGKDLSEINTSADKIVGRAGKIEAVNLEDEIATPTQSGATHDARRKSERSVPLQ